jgi:hypothetical protein
LKKRIAILVALLVVVMAVPLSAGQWDLGLSATPAFVGEDDQIQPDQDKGVFDTLLPGFHFGYRWAGILYLSWEALVMPPELITMMTGYMVEEDSFSYFKYGPYAPGFLNLWDFGVKALLGPVVLHTELGVNTIYVYKQSEIPNEFKSNFGANWRAGIGGKFNNWGVNLDFTALFPSFKSMMSDIRTLVGDDPEAKAAVRTKIRWIPSLSVILYL